MGKAGGGGIGLIILIVVYLLAGGLPGGGGGGLGVDPGTGQFSPSPGASSTDLDKAPADDPAKFVDFVAGDVDATWTKIFAESGKTYEPETIVLFDNGVSTGCGNAPSTVGPFYCPNDRKVYLDLTFLDQLQKQLGASGDFARAYVIAHEIGHHVQNQLGVMQDVDQATQENPDDRNKPRSGSSSRPTASPASGRTRPSPRATCWRAETWRKVSMPRPPSATTGSRSNPAGASIPTHSRTAHRRSA